MVSFWPFGGDDKSAASFEKRLSQLSTKINTASTRNDSFRQHQRRFKALWTLYSLFAYILIAAILTFVTGYQTWGVVEYSAIAGGPVLIYGIRTLLDLYYNYRIANSQAQLDDLYKQRQTAINKLKEATKYDSTQQLLDKYGGSPRKRPSSPQPPRKRKSEGTQGQQAIPQGPRTGFAPPPTANIPRASTLPPPSIPESARRSTIGLSPEAAALMQPQSTAPNEDFAPNAFETPIRPPTIRQQSTQYAEGPKWYDRIMDVILGEDETQAKNRMVLICESCRLVNGQAPPGARTLEDVGRWRCSSCHAWNGVESEEKRMLKQITGQPQTPVSPDFAPESAISERARQDTALEDENGEYEHVEEDIGDDELVGEDDVADPVADSPATSTRSKARKKRT